MTISFLEGSRAIAQTIANIQPDVVSAYPITPQTHIVEDLARFKAEKKADYEYLLAESEAAAASIVLGASAAGARVYTATSSQGLLLMLEVLYNAAGLRLPLVMTVANRAVGAPINIWNDHSDAMAMRDAGWVMLFAENHQEAVDLHVIAYRLAESTNLPVAVNVDGFILTHSHESVIIPDNKTIKKILPDYLPTDGAFLDTKNPTTIGGFFTSEHYWLERKQLDTDLKNALPLISKLYKQWKKILPTPSPVKAKFENGLLEYCGPSHPETLIIAMGSMAGTIKETIKDNKSVGLLKIRSFRPFPDIRQFTTSCKHIAVVEKAMSSGASGPLYAEVGSSLYNYKGVLSDNIVGLGGRDVSLQTIKHIIKSSGKAGIKFW
ncbi:pyruvate ferredoxin oxidoreductase [Candidatus Falkowbacteria bacterium HGW-Falkowbacteria-2]|uniref:Pyruvate ferredoxin oxidoreductase n=1 Tax=Candidatus Falkowbacteria bacterium HGW-Falkowbacteria-2 TaxID=2013769 RepID=A0A2N2E0J0_9BACT|nr:MAG: pyruvate ferredoxin oxidoreductase [Candidatus Falkowbacteria bacterium HGW-Falkowbacteria-2]